MEQWLSGVAWRVQSLIREHDALPRFQEMALAWVKSRQGDDPTRKRLNMRDDWTLTLEEKYAFLGAVHDSIGTKADKVIPVPDDIPDDDNSFEKGASARTWVTLMVHVGRLTEKADKDWLDNILKEVERDLEYSGVRAESIGNSPSGQRELAGKEVAQCTLPNSAKMAYHQYLEAERVLAEQDNNKPTDKQCYDWHKTHNDRDTLPGFDTWNRYLRQARKALGKQKNTPRAGRKHGPSIVHMNDI